MRNFYSTGLLFTTLLFAGTSQAQDAVSQDIADQLQFTLDSAIEKMKLIGVSANVTMPDGKVWNSTGGLSDPTMSDPMNPDHLLWSASMCKLFTGGVILQLAEEGKLSLEDKIGKYVTGINNIDTNVTLREMIKHRSGIGEVLNNTSTSQWYNNPNKIWTSREVLETYLPTKTFNHGQGFEYSNSNYLLLGMVVNEITGRTLGEEIHSRFLTPLGMTTTFFMPEDVPDADVTPCWADFDGDGIWTDQANFILTPSFSSMVAGAGALLTKPADVSKYTRALFGGQLVSDSILVQMKQCTQVSFGPNCNGYGMATMRYLFFGKYWYGHGGDISGFTTMTVHQPETNITLTLMINQDRQNRAALATALIKKLNLISTGISQNEMSSKISIENPVTEQINISSDLCEDINADIIAIEGRLINSIRIVPGRNEVALNGLTPGMYQIIFRSGSEVNSRKFIKL